MTVPLKLKYRTQRNYTGGKYRPRTGPRCCNIGCPSTKKKSRKKGGLGRAHAAKAA